MFEKKNDSCLNFPKISAAFNLNMDIQDINIYSHYLLFKPIIKEKKNKREKTESILKIMKHR